MFRKILPGLLLVMLLLPTRGQAEATLRLGLLAYGTAHWELTALQALSLPGLADVDLTVRELSTAEAGKIALQSDAVDIIVSDWLWVAAQRAAGRNYAFYPYSKVSGGIVSQPEHPLSSITDLTGLRIGVAGGELDKNWLLLSALYRKSTGQALEQQAQIVFAAPPLLSRQLQARQLDVVLTYWHFAARLEAQGFQLWRQGDALLNAMNLEPELPFLGYVFRRDWAEANRPRLTAFLHGVAEAREQLCTNDTRWQSIVPLTRSKDSVTQNLLRQRYCQGRVQAWESRLRSEADNTFKVLQALSGSRLTGKQRELDPKTFWSLSAP
ncbi:MAG: ABC transporter substrate-binding protein [Methylococcales bacterium]|nr:ABC transporter substrate-binding protein [Methylococcales bacterium]